MADAAAHEKHEGIRSQLNMKVDELQATKQLAGEGAESNGKMAAKLLVHESAKDAAAAEATIRARKAFERELQKSAAKEAALQLQADQLLAELNKKRAEGRYWLAQQMKATAGLKKAIKEKKAAVAAADKHSVTAQAYKLHPPHVKTADPRDVEKEEVETLEKQLRDQVAVVDSRKAALAASNCSEAVMDEFPEFAEMGTGSPF